MTTTTPTTMQVIYTLEVKSDQTMSAGSEYTCKAESQAEWAHHVNVPSSEPQHPDSPHYRPGVYNSRMFAKPGQTQDNGIHVIMLDARSGRDPTYSSHGDCKGSDTSILSDSQWSWLEEELEKNSEIKIIGSGIQVRRAATI